MMTTIIVIAVFLNLLMAMIHYVMIDRNKKIQHAWWAAGYLVICALCAHLFANIWYIFPMLFVRPVVFDPVLNMARKLHPFHVSLTTTSVIDKWEVKLIGTNGFVHWLIWLGLTVVSVVVLNLVK